MEICPNHLIFFNASNISISILNPFSDISGNTFLPACVIFPNFSILRQRSLFNSDHIEPFFVEIIFVLLFHYQVFLPYYLSNQSTKLPPQHLYTKMYHHFVAYLVLLSPNILFVFHNYFLAIVLILLYFSL